MRYALILLVFFSFYTFAEKSECDTGLLKTTLECHYSELKKTELELQSVHSAISKKYESDKLFIGDFDKARMQWEQSLKSSCGAVYSLWRHGSVKNIKWLQCKRKLTIERIDFLNQEFVKLQ